MSWSVFPVEAAMPVQLPDVSSIAISRIQRGPLVQSLPTAPSIERERDKLAVLNDRLREWLVSDEDRQHFPDNVYVRAVHAPLMEYMF
jgi:hypothetical protein